MVKEFLYTQANLAGTFLCDKNSHKIYPGDGDLQILKTKNLQIFNNNMTNSRFLSFATTVAGDRLFPKASLKQPSSECHVARMPH